MKQDPIYRRRRRNLVIAFLLVVILIAVVIVLSARGAADTSPVTTDSLPTTTGPTTETQQDPAQSTEALESGSTAPVPSGGPADALPDILPPDAVAVHVPILMYHYVNETPPPAGPYADGLTVRTNDFIAEMQYLTDNGHHTVSLADMYLAMAGLRELPPKPVVLTFDDGGLDNYEVAFPILQEHGFVGTFFVITKTVGREGQMTWDQLREMAAAGMSVESHTVSHPDLSTVGSERLQSELIDSRDAIAEAIGTPSRFLCYPAGAYNDDVIAAAKDAGYLMAVATDKGREGDPDAVFELKRKRISPFMPIDTFARLVQ